MRGNSEQPASTTANLDAGLFEVVLDSLDEGVVTLTGEGAVIGINRAACEILEVSRDEALQRGCPFLMGDDVCKQGSLVRQSISDRKPIRDLEAEIVTRSGRQKVLDIRTSLLRNAVGGTRGGLIVFRDVTELVRLRRDLQQRYRLHNIIGKSKPMREVFELIEQVADSDATVLIEGETGTGKELVARAIHHLSTRSGGPFVAVNCSALPETLLESELFGHVRGAFTGAARDKVGRFEAAGGGTIFLDEIGDISPPIQIKLLRVLQERTIERVGGEQTIRVDIRVISATHRPLAEMVAAGSFRQDLFYRLRVVPIHLPPLRERRDDIPLLAQHFVEQFRRRTERPIEGLHPDALARLVDYDWPGNVRELENVIEYAFVKARGGLVTTAHLPPDVLAGSRSGNSVSRDTPAAPARSGSLPGPQQIAHVLTAAGWNISKAARRLGISRTTLYKYIARYGLREPAWDGGDGPEQRAPRSDESGAAS